MTAPLYNNCAKPSECDKGGNRGLWFERFFDQYNERANWEVGTEKTRWLSEHFKNKQVGNSKQLERHAQAQIQLAKSLQGQSHIFTASWHFVTGMGNPHPVENGFAWHPTLGVPYLTGAAVKGLVRSYIENNLDTENPENPDKKELLLQWFGSTDKDPKNHTKEMPAQAGELIFFDALPTKPVTLGVDIMTPHMGKWYEKGGDKDANKPETIPADWHDPNPVAFLVATDIMLHFSFALRRTSDIDLNDVQQVLGLALEHAGAGGKTATGYGGFSSDEKENQKAALVGLSGAELFEAELNALDDKKLAEMLGKNFNKTKEGKGLDWEVWLDVVFSEKQVLIKSWEQAEKNSAGAKAYSNLKNKTGRIE